MERERRILTRDWTASIKAIRGSRGYAPGGGPQMKRERREEILTTDRTASTRSGPRSA